MAELTNTSHLETIDYKPPAKPTSTTSFLSDEKKTDHEDEDERRGDHDDHDNEEADEDDAKFDLYSEEAEWDEGGKSHCGYGETLHSTLMSVGETVHKMVGDPSPHVEKELKAVGNWFQEASYAARDLLGGSNGNGDESEAVGGMGEDAMDAVKTLLRGGSKEDKESEEAAPATTEESAAAAKPGESMA